MVHHCVPLVCRYPIIIMQSTKQVHLCHACGRADQRLSMFLEGELFRRKYKVNVDLLLPHRYGILQSANCIMGLSVCILHSSFARCTQIYIAIFSASGTYMIQRILELQCSKSTNYFPRHIAMSAHNGPTLGTRMPASSVPRNCGAFRGPPLRRTYWAQTTPNKYGNACLRNSVGHGAV